MIRHLWYAVIFCFGVVPLFLILFSLPFWPAVIFIYMQEIGFSESLSAIVSILIMAPCFIGPTVFCKGRSNA